MALKYGAFVLLLLLLLLLRCILQCPKLLHTMHADAVLCIRVSRSA